MATNKKKQQRKQKKALEAKRLADRGSTQKEGRPTPSASDSKNVRTRRRDSSGKAIPSEKQRQEQPRVISFAEIKDDKTEKARAARANARRYGQADSDGVHARRKVKYVLDKAAKKWLLKVLAIFLVVIIAIVAGIHIATVASAPPAVETPTAEEKTVSLTGITSQGKSLIEMTGKFDGFLDDESGIPKSSIYDTDISLEDAAVLKERGQYPSDGIFAYNEDFALKKKSKSSNDNLAPDNDTVAGSLS